jgi:hypothetical protein
MNTKTNKFQQKRRYIVGSIFTLSVLGLTTSIPNVSATATSFSGKWKTNYGTMTLRQDANGSVTGQYDNGGTIGDINGTVSDNTLTGTWTENGADGNLKFVISANGGSFKGSWNRTSGKGEPGGVWNGTKVNK